MFDPGRKGTIVEIRESDDTWFVEGASSGKLGGFSAARLRLA